MPAEGLSVFGYFGRAEWKRLQKSEDLTSQLRTLKEALKVILDVQKQMARGRPVAFTPATWIETSALARL